MGLRGSGGVVGAGCLYPRGWGVVAESAAEHFPPRERRVSLTDRFDIYLAYVVFAGGQHRKVLAGGKSETRIPAEGLDAPVRVGRDYSVQAGWAKPTLGRIRIIAVSSQRLGDISKDSIKREGFKTRDEFEAWWTEQYGTFDLNLSVWAIVFMLTDSPLLLAKDSTHGYTHDPKLAMDREPEAVDPDEIETYGSSKEARARYEQLHSEERRRAALRSQLGRLRESAIRQIKNGGDPSLVLEAAAAQLEGSKNG